MYKHFKFILIIFTFILTCNTASYAQDNMSSIEHISIPPTWQPNEKQKHLVETQFKKYKALLHNKKYEEAFQLHTSDFKQVMPFDKWLHTLKSSLKGTGGNSKYVATKITWYKNSSNAPKLGIYSAVDYECSYANFNTCTGFVILYSEQGDNFAITRTEENRVVKNEAELLQEQKTKASDNSPTTEDVDQTPNVICDIGPATKNYGDAPWLVYSCNDKQSVIFVSDTGNPAMPFMFFIYLKDNVYNLHGEGTGSKEATKATYDELTQLSITDIEKLIAETQQVKK